jgi:RimJ/RimL family protein N-acetyltransferase
VITPQLLTPRLRLDTVTPADTDDVLAYCVDPEIQRWVPLPVPYTRESAEFFTGKYATSAAEGDEFTLWAIRDAESPRILGAIELRNQPLASGGIGYWLGREHRGSGIMTEAVEAIVEYAFAEGGLELQRLEWSAVAGNVASGIVARRAGFRFEGEQRKSSVFRDTRVDTWYATLLRDDDREQQEGWPL